MISGLDYSGITKMATVLTRNILGRENSSKCTASLDWKRLVNLEQRQVFGLDIGSSHVKLVQLRKDNAGYVVTAAEIAYIEDGVRGTRSDKAVNTVSAISQCLQSAGIQSRLAVCGVSGPEVAVRHFKFPLMASEEIEGAVLLEAAQVCPFNVDDAAVDYQLISDGQDRTNGVLVAATNKVIGDKAKFIKDAHLDCVLMDINGLALLNCLGECEKPVVDRPIAVLNISSSFTNLAVMSGNGLPFIRDISYAGDDIVAQMATASGVSGVRIRQILSGAEGENEAEAQLGDSFEKACRKLVVDVTETLRYYTAQEKSSVVEQVFVCGGFALVKGFVELLDNELSASVVLWNPFEKMRCDASVRCENILARSGPAMAAAAGFAMRTI